MNRSILPAQNSFTHIVSNNNLAEELSKRFLASAQHFRESQRNSQKAYAGQQPLEINFYKTNRDGTIVTLDAEGRATALADKTGKQIYRFEYRGRTSQEPDSIKFFDGTSFVKRYDVKATGQATTVWVMRFANENNPNAEFQESILTINTDGSFQIKYKCLIASKIKRGEVVREISFNARGRKVVEFEKAVCTRIGPNNSVTIREMHIRRAASQV